MHKHYEEEFKRKIVQLHIGEGRSIRSLSEEYKVSHGSITSWTTQFRKECEVNEKSKAEYDYMVENLKLKNEIAELQKEISFLKKTAKYFAKEIEY